MRDLSSIIRLRTSSRSESTHRVPLERRQVVLRDAQAAQLVRDVLRAGGELWVTASGRSMLPVIQDGARVLLGPLTGRPVLHDVVLAEVGQRSILHRVVALAEEGVVLRGDACDEDDPLVSYDRLIARAIAARRNDRVIAFSSTLRFGWRPLLAGWQLRMVRRARRIKAAIIVRRRRAGVRA